jgi:hypothetical protein
MLVWYLAMRTCCLKASGIMWKQVFLLSRTGNIAFGLAKNSSLLLFHTSWGQTHVQNGRVSTFIHVKCWKRLCAVSQQVMQLSVGNTRSFSIWTACIVTFCKYMWCWEIFTKLRTMFCNNGIYSDVALYVDGWCTMVCQHVHYVEEHAFIAWSHCCLKWSYWCFGGYHITAVRTCCPGLRTCWQTKTHQRSTGNVTFLHPLHCCRTWCRVCESLPTAHLLTVCHSTTSLNRIGKCVSNPKVQDLVENGNQSFTTLGIQENHIDVSSVLSFVLSLYGIKARNVFLLDQDK